MAKIQITENELKQIIRESVKSVLAEGLLPADQKYTLGDLIKAIGYQGNVNDLISRAGNAQYTAQQWAKAINTQAGRVKNRQLGAVYQKLASQISNSIEDRAAVSAGIQKAADNGGTLVAGNPYSTGPGGQNVAPNAGKPFTFTQLTQSLGNKRGTTMSFRQVLHDSVGPWNGQDEKAVRNTITNQIRRVKPTLTQINPENAQKAEDVLTKWLSGGYPYRTSDVHWAMSVFDQVINPARNDMPIVSGFQKALNAFGMKDAQGRPYAVDGIIGKNTSAALKQAGYKDIFEFKNDVVNFQKAAGLKQDGIVGNQTLGAFQQNNIHTLADLKQFNQVQARRQQDSQNKIAQVTPSPALQGQVQVTPASQPSQTLAGPKPGAPQA